MEDMSVWNLVIAGVWVPVFGWMLINHTSDKKDKDKTIDSLKGRVQALEATAVRKEEVRAIVKEEIQPLFSDYDEIKADMKMIAENVVQIRIEQAASNARGSAYDRSDEHSRP